MFRRCLLAVLLLLAPVAAATAQINVPPTVQRDTPIIAGCNCVTPEGAELKVRWTVVPMTRTSDAALVPVGNAGHIWAKPGTYMLIAQATWHAFEEIEIPTADGGTRVVKILVAWDSASYSSTFRVVEGDDPDPEPDPDPDPDPDPEPSDFEGMILDALEEIGNPPSRTRVAQVYRDIAEEANVNRDVYTPAVMVDASKTNVGSALSLAELATWQPFWPKMNDAFRAREMEADDTDAFITAFREFADILEK